MLTRRCVKIFSPFLLLCTYGLNSFADEIPSLPEKTKAKIGEPVRLSAPKDAKNIKWTCSDPDVKLVPKAWLAKNTDAVLILNKLDSVTVSYVASTASGELLFGQTIIEVEGARPPPVQPPVVPPVTPPVQPPEEPTTTGRLQVVIIEETADAATERGKFFSDPDLVAYIQSKGHKVSNFDKDYVTTDPDAKKKLDYYLADAKKGGSLPWVLLINIQENKVKYRGPLAKTPAEFLTLLKKYGG